MIDCRSRSSRVLLSCCVLAVLLPAGAPRVEADTALDDALSLPRICADDPDSGNRREAPAAACEASLFPICDGDCPPGESCSAGPGQCACVPDAVPCEESTFPACDGDCPGGLICIEDSSVPPGICRCEAAPVPCEISMFPVCDGVCPPGESCAAGLAGSDCVCEPTPACEEAAFPECDGICRAGRQCAPGDRGDQCECQGPGCQDSPFPACDGECPADSLCMSPLAGNGGCECTPCDGNLPAEVSNFHWLDKIDFEWDELACATAYNVYRETAIRLIDADSDGLADSYGICFSAGLPAAVGSDPSNPVSGTTCFYLVTGENPSGEGSLGAAGNGLGRPNTSPCP